MAPFFCIHRLIEISNHQISNSLFNDSLQHPLDHILLGSVVIS